LQPSQKVLSLAAPARAKQTHVISGSAGEAAKELVRVLREEARVL
jgi:electron transfer flavoprotein alpha/beta subunit